MNGVSVTTYTMNHHEEPSQTLPGTMVCNEDQPGCTNGSNLDADHAQMYSFDTLLFYLQHHNRLSLDGDGMPIIISVNYGNDYQNSFWDGYEAVFGDNEPTDDTVGHELTHGVTDSTSGLFYYYQSGAISESFSDLWGEFIDQTNDKGNDGPSSKWLLGEDNAVYRNMSNPPANRLPDRMTSEYYHHGELDNAADFDNGGVHTNSGVNNKAVFLMTDGGSFNGYTIAGLGLDKVAAIYYEAQTHLLVSGSNYKDLYYSLHQACLNVIGGTEGVTIADCAEVQKAVDAVEMNKSPLTNFMPEAQICAKNAQPINLFYDDFESSNSSWDFTSHTPANVSWQRGSGYAADGEFSIISPDVSITSDISSISPSVNIPTTGNTYLYFKHAFGFEYGKDNTDNFRTWDGGVLEYRIDNGSWQDANSLFDSGQGYNGSIFNYSGGTNPLANRNAFVRDSHGYVSSRYNLNTSAIRGHNIKFRWRVGSDNNVGDLGWLVDDVHIYTCELNSPGASSFSDDFSSAKSWTDNSGGLVVRDAVNQQLNWTARQDTPLHYTIPIYATNDPIQLDFRFKVNSSTGDGLIWVGLARELDDISPGVAGVDLAGTFLGIDSTNKFQILSLNPDLSVSKMDSTASTVEYGGNSVWRRAILTVNDLDWNLVVKDDNGSQVGQMSGTLLQQQDQYKYLVLMNDFGGGTGIETGSIDDINVYGTACHTITLTHTGNGSEVTASPQNSPYCPTGMYLPGETIQLSNALSDIGWKISGWSGTGNDSSVLDTNTLVMPNQDHAVVVKYIVDTSTYSISGRIVTLSGTPLAGVTVSDGLGHSSITDSSGNYSLLILSAGIKTITPTKAGFTFAPVNRQVRIGPNATGINFTSDNQIPTNISLVPNSAIPGGPAFTITVNGTYFVGNSVVRWNGVDLPTTYLNDNRLTAQVDSSDIAAIGTASVTVFNPAPGGGTSNPLLFSTIDHSPAIDQKLANNKVNFTWDDIPGANLYTIQLSIYESFTTTVLNTTATTSDYSYTTAFANGRIYYWRVRPRFGSVWGDWLPAWRFYSMNPPVAPIQTSPVLNWITNDVTPEFLWNSVTNGDHYQIQISKSSTLIPTTTDESLAPGVLNFISTTQGDGVYYWRVRAIDSVGVEGAWSLARYFTLDTVNPLPPVLNLPVNNAPLIRATPAFIWLAAVGANAYQFQYDEATDFSDPAYTSGVLSVLTHTPSPAMGLGTWYWRVKSRDAAGNWSDWSGYRTITILPPIPAAPILTTPGANSFTNDNTPDFNWNPVTGAAKYEIQIDNLPTFAVPIEMTANDVVTNTYTALTSLTDGLKYWRVRAYNTVNEPGTWSLVRFFTVDTIAQAVPAMSAPANGATVQTTIPTLIVGTVSGALYYQFQVDDADEFTSPLVDVTRTTTVYAIPIAQALPFGTNYWRVRSIDAAGNASGWSTPRSFVVTILYVPVNQSYTFVTKPVLTWTTAAGALAYHIQVDDSNIFDLPELDVTRPVSSSYTPTIALPFNIYYWRMQVQTASGWSNWTPVYTFTVTPVLPVAPAQTTPATATITNDNTPTLNWNSVTNGVTYQVQISNVTTFVSQEQTQVLDPGVLTYTATTLPDGIHYWRVRAINYLNVPGAWSLARSFTVDTVAPGVPAIVYPAAGTSIRGTPRFYMWSVVAGAVYYQYAYAISSDFSDVIYTSGDLTLPYLIPPVQTPGTYNWHVRARDGAGNWGGWSSTGQVTIIP
jgi:hypothetical protein